MPTITIIVDETHEDVKEMVRALNPHLGDATCLAHIPENKNQHGVIMPKRTGTNLLTTLKCLLSQLSSQATYSRDENEMQRALPISKSTPMRWYSFNFWSKSK